jgi:hypothetical protein
LMEQELALSLCLRWHKCHGKRPDVQHEVKHEGLKTILARTRSLTKDEWRDLHVTDTIDKNSWVAASDDSSWFAPRFKTLTVSPDAAKEIPQHNTYNSDTYTYEWDMTYTRSIRRDIPLHNPSSPDRMAARR